MQRDLAEGRRDAWKAWHLGIDLPRAGIPPVVTCTGLMVLGSIGAFIPCFLFLCSILADCVLPYDCFNHPGRFDAVKRERQTAGF